MLEKYGITSYMKALLAASFPSQMKFVNFQKAEDLFETWKKNSLHLGSYIIGALFIILDCKIHNFGGRRYCDFHVLPCQLLECTSTSLPDTHD